jgi:hypothetical protein
VTAQGAGLDKQLAGVAPTSTARPARIGRSPAAHPRILRRVWHGGDQVGAERGHGHCRVRAVGADTITKPGPARVLGHGDPVLVEKAHVGTARPGCLPLELFDRPSHTGAPRILGVRLERE